MTTLAGSAASNSAAPGALGFLIVFALVVILVFVFRSMSKHIRKINQAAAAQAEAEQAKPAADAPARSAR